MKKLNTAQKNIERILSFFTRRYYTCIYMHVLSGHHHVFAYVHVILATNPQWLTDTPRVHPVDSLGLLIWVRE